MNRTPTLAASLLRCPQRGSNSRSGRPFARIRLLLLSLSTAAFAQQPAPFTQGDAKAGHALADRDCNACHVQRFGNASAIHTRPDRRVTSPGQLLAQVQRCNLELNKGYFPDEEEHLAAYLNTAYYKFK